MVKSTKEKQELKRLVEQADQARAKISATGSKVSDKLGFVGDAKGSVKKDPVKWVGASAVIGLLASLLLGSKKKKKARARAASLAAAPRSPGSLIWKVLVLVVRLVKPAGKIYATKLIKDYLQGRLNNGSAAHPRAVRVVRSK